MSEQGMRDPWEREFNVGTGRIKWTGGDRDLRIAVQGDWLDLPPERLAYLLASVADMPHLTWCMFSERLGEWLTCLQAVARLGTNRMLTDGEELARDWYRGSLPPNVYVGTTVTSQAEADERIPELLAIPARVRVLRCTPREPLDLSAWIGRVDHCVSCGAENAPQGPDVCPECGQEGTLVATWGDHQHGLYPDFEEPDGPAIGWVVCEGGDTPMHPEWVRSLRDQAEEAGVPFWFSGWGKHVPELPPWRSEWGKWRNDYASQAGRLLDGRTWNGVPS